MGRLNGPDPARAAALRANLEAHSPDLLAYFVRRVHVREDAADLLAETMLQAWRRVDDVPLETERGRMWLFTAAAHVLANHRRSVRRRGSLADKVRAHLQEPVVPDAAPAATEAMVVRDAVRLLDDAHRELVMLVHWDGLSLVEAAEVLGLNPSTARGRYAAAREALRTALADCLVP